MNAPTQAVLIGRPVTLADVRDVAQRRATVALDASIRKELVGARQELLLDLALRRLALRIGHPEPREVTQELVAHRALLSVDLLHHAVALHLHLEAGLEPARIDQRLLMRLVIAASTVLNRPYCGVVITTVSTGNWPEADCGMA